MFRVVLIHQLVLSLLVGPMLCCCTAARLGHEPARTSQSDGKPDRKHCCGEPRPTDDGHQAPGGKPGGPEKCPCKDSPRTEVVTPETPAAAADVLTLLTSGFATLDHPLGLHAPVAMGRSTAFLDARSSTLSADDILYAHHKLRC